MVCCCVPFCTNRFTRRNELSFHSFPKEENTRQRWLHAIRRDVGENFRLTKYTKVCGVHFPFEDFQPLLHSRKAILKPGVIPSIFAWTNSKENSAREARAIKRTGAKIRENRKLSEPVVKSRHGDLIDVERQLEQFPSARPLLLSIENTDFHESPTLETQVYNNVILDSACAQGTTETQEDLQEDSLCFLNPQEFQNYNTMDKEKDTVEALLMLSSQGNNELEELKRKVVALENKVKLQAETIVQCKGQITKLKKKEFSLQAVSKNSEVFSSYTGLPNRDTFECLLKFLTLKAKKMKYWRGSVSKTEKHFRYMIQSKICKPGEKRQLTIRDEFFMILIRLRQGTPLIELARLFGTSISYVSKTFVTWINFLYVEFKELFVLPARNLILNAMPPQFLNYRNTTAILDCTEIRLERPSSLQRQRETFSNYKHYNTCKCMIAITPGGLVIMVSKLYGGGCSDKHIAKESGLYDLLKAGDELMVDKGFEIKEDLPSGVKLNIPAKFMKKVSSQMPAEDVNETRKIASVRVHVERAIRRMKVFNILNIIPISMLPYADQIVAVCAFLTNFQPALINKRKNQ